MDLMTLRARLFLDDSDYNAGLNSAEKRAGSFGSAVKSGFKTVAKVGAVAMAAAGTAALAFTKKAVEAGLTFDKSMSAVSATMGKKAHEIISYNGEQMESIDALNLYAKEMGRTTAFSATEAADALGYMALAGYNATDSMSMLPTVLNLAAAGDIELASASDMVTDAQSALGLTMEQTTEMVNQMAVASSTTNTSVGQLGEAMLTVGGTAKTMKGGTAELTQVLGLLADNGIKGAEGGTTLRNMIISLSKPTKSAQKELKKLGVAVYDSNGEMRSMQDIFGDLNGALGKMSSKQRTQAIAKIFNKTDLKAVNALLGTSAERWDEVGEAIENAEGAAEEMANTKLDNLAGDITLFQSALEGAKLALSDKLAPVLRNVVQYGTKAIERLTTAFEQGGFSGLIDELTNVLSEVLQKVMEYVPKFIEVAAKLLVSLATGIANSLPTLIRAVPQIIIAIVNALKEHWGEIKKAGKDAIIALAEGITGESNESGSVGKALLGLAGVILGILLKLLQALGNWLKTTAFPAIFEWISGAWESFKTSVSTAWESIKQFFAGIWESIKESAVTAWNNLTTALSAAWEIIKTKGATFGTNVKTFFSNTWESIKTTAVEKWNALKESISGIWEDIKTTAGEKIEAIKTVVSEKVEAVKETFLGIIDTLKTNVSEKWESIKETFSTFIEKIKGLFNFEFKFPSIKLPHIYVKSYFTVLGAQIPKSFGISWYKKAYDTPWLFTKPTVMGNRGFGDGGGSGEIVYGRDALMNDIREAVGWGQPPVINVYQREGEDTMALSRRIEQDLLKIMQRGKAGALYV